MRAVGVVTRFSAGVTGVYARWANGARRKTAVISAMMEMAISTGVWAPIGSPTGPRMRAIAASSKPTSFSLYTRFAWVLREPSAPM